MFSCHLKGTTFRDFLFSSLEDVAVLKRDLLLKERICSSSSSFSPSGVDVC